MSDPYEKGFNLAVDLSKQSAIMFVKHVLETVYIKTGVRVDNIGEEMMPWIENHFKELKL